MTTTIPCNRCKTPVGDDAGFELDMKINGEVKGTFIYCDSCAKLLAACMISAFESDPNATMSAEFDNGTVTIDKSNKA